jgi:hypothetical protein
MRRYRQIQAKVRSTIQVETHNLERPLTAFDDEKLVALGFDESCELAALVAGIRDDRFDRRKDWALDRRANVRRHSPSNCQDFSNSL